MGSSTNVNWVSIDFQYARRNQATAAQQNLDCDKATIRWRMCHFIHRAATIPIIVYLYASIREDLEIQIVKPQQNNYWQNFANFWRARSRLYQNEILQENMRLTTFFKLYKICILLHPCNLKIFAKNRFEKLAIFVKIQQKSCKCRKIYKILPNFKKFS